MTRWVANLRDTEADCQVGYLTLRVCRSTPSSCREPQQLTRMTTRDGHPHQRAQLCQLMIR